VEINGDMLLKRKNLLRYSIWIEQKADYKDVLEIQKKVVKKYNFTPINTGFHLTVFFIGDLNDLAGRIMTATKRDLKEVVDELFSFVKWLMNINVPSGKVKVTNIEVFRSYKNQFVLLDSRSEKG
jgi:hypothetical protein